MKNLLLMLCVLAAFAACSKDSDAPADKTVATGRTVIVYMSGENSLSPYVTYNLNEMLDGSKKLGSEDCLLVYVDRSRSSEVPWMAVKMSEMNQLANATRTALQSIKAKQTTTYAIPYQTDGRPVVKVGVKFDAEKRVPEEWIICM